MATNGAPQIKVEQTGAADEGVRFKQEIDSADASPAAVSDDDLYEDAGDLDFSNAAQGVWLTRIPKWLWENWSQIDDDEEVQIGTVRLEGTPSEVKQLSLFLDPEVERNKDIPKQYNMQITNHEPQSTFIFTEKDLPGYARKARGDDGTAQFVQLPSRYLQRDRNRFRDRERRSGPYFRKAIPKQTSIVGSVKHEVNCLPVENKEYEAFIRPRTLEFMEPKRQTRFVDGNVAALGGNLLNPGTLGGTGGFNTFIKTGTAIRKPQEQKAARMPQNELLDLLISCFKRYTYWPMSALKAELKQPEAYLKQTLEKIAQLVKTGRFANTWALKPEARLGTYEGVKDERAPDVGYASDGMSEGGELDVGGIPEEYDDDDDENVKMEDVMPS